MLHHGVLTLDAVPVIDYRGHCQVLLTAWEITLKECIQMNAHYLVTVQAQCALSVDILLLSHCWFSVRKSIWPVKYWGAGMVLAWLFAWSEMQMICTWPSWCYCHPIISCFIKIQIGLTFLVLAYPGCSRKEAVKQVSVSVHPDGHLDECVCSWLCS